ncbi:MAG: VOC family protein [Solirubrobacteraceae bacterium]|nr:VOC family protein [Solirubrobacteraceae bacterium]
MMKLSTVQVWVHDQQEALDWWTGKLGFEVRQDLTVAEMDDFRWLSVGPVGQPDVAIVLMAIPGGPVFSDETVGQIEALLAKGASGGLFFTTDDINARYAELKEAGVEFTQELTQMPYGIDCGFRDPSGNHYRLAQLGAA